MSDKFWNFSKTERISAVVLVLIIAVVLATSFFEKNRSDLSIKDYSAEIEDFKNRIVPADTIKPEVKKKSKRSSNKYTPNKQNLSPITKEN